MEDTASMKFMNIWCYDIEIYPNLFTVGFENMDTGERFIFEITERIDHGPYLWNFLQFLIRSRAKMVGYNNLRFDYVLIHEFLTIGAVRPVTALDMYLKGQAIIDAKHGDWTHSVAEWHHLIQQVDMMVLNGFKGPRATSLKKLEIAMRSTNVKDLPIKPGEHVPRDQIEGMITYMCWDISETAKFAKKTWDNVEFRQSLDDKLGGRRSRINWDDVRIGSEYLLDELRASGVRTHMNRKAIQTTWPDGIVLADILLPVEFDDPGLQGIYRFFQSATVLPDKIKGFFADLSATVGGLKMDFGTGGLHGAIPHTTFRATGDRIIQLRDVVSYYPRIAVANGWYPTHLGPIFTEKYDDLFQQRKQHKKGTPENLLFKLGLNGSFGKTGDKYSPLRDESYMLKVTINGQLLLARLTEVLMRIASLTVIQVNTDGVAYICDKADEPQADAICEWWEQITGLSLGTENYSLFAQRDVNNYFAIEVD